MMIMVVGLGGKGENNDALYGYNHGHTDASYDFIMWC